MTWYFSMMVTDCDHDDKGIAGAVITDRITGGGVTDDYGHCTFAVYDDNVDGWIVEVSHAGYTARNVTIYKNQQDTTIATCLHAAGSHTTDDADASAAGAQATATGDAGTGDGSSDDTSYA
jgi:hypothetical protein